MYCLDALRRFDQMSREEIFTIVSEIAMKGQSGIDYAPSDTKYTLQSIPGEQFSSLQGNTR